MNQFLCVCAKGYPLKLRREQFLFHLGRSGSSFTFWSRGRVQDYGELLMSWSTGLTHLMHVDVGIRFEILQRVQFVR